MNIPFDIKQYVRKSIIKQLIKWLVATVIMVVLLILTDNSFSVAGMGAKIFIYATLILVPFFVFKIHLLIVDRSWQGIITSVYTDDGISNRNKAFPTYEAAMRTIAIMGVVTLPDGDTRTVALYAGRLDNSVANLLNKYEVGNRVVHIRGTKNYQVITDVSISCVVCGHINQRSYRTCSECGHTLKIIK